LQASIAMEKSRELAKLMGQEELPIRIAADWWRLV
jgi:hypothetical protein